jgi:RNA polymerase sigma factor (sigma-70 family)
VPTTPHPAKIGQRRRETFFSLIGQHLESLYRFVRHRLAYLEAAGDLAAGALTPEEVVDAVVLRAYREFVEAPSPRRMGSWLMGLARAQLDAEVARLEAWHRRTPTRLEDDVPETPPTQEVSTLGDEILDFYEPEEDLKVEDVVPDLEMPTPEQVAEARELQACVTAALAGLPKEWRRALLLRHVEGLAGADLGRALGRPEPEVQRMLRHASHYLRQRLVESGCAFKPEEGRSAVPGRAERVAT